MRLERDVEASVVVSMERGHVWEIARGMVLALLLRCTYGRGGRCTYSWVWRCEYHMVCCNFLEHSM